MRFIHTADIHLGAAPDHGREWSDARKMEIWDSFSRLIDRVRLKNIDLLLIAGDLFHGQPLYQELMEVKALFESIPETQIVMIAGNHDYICPESYYPDFEFGSNVHGLWGEEWKRVFLREINTYVYGFSYHSNEITRPLYNFMRPDSAYPDAIHILLGHCGDEKHIPVSKEVLKEAGFDYAALGHIHKPQILIKDRAAFCGALEPLERNDTGEHGFIEGEIKDKQPCIEFVPFAKRSYKSVQIPVNPGSTQYSIRQEMLRIIDGDDDIYSFVLHGTRAREITFNPDAFLNLGNIVDVTDNTRPDFDYEGLLEENEGNLIGEYIRHFINMEQTPLNNRALSIGLRALMERMR